MSGTVHLPERAQIVAGEMPNEGTTIPLNVKPCPINGGSVEAVGAQLGKGRTAFKPPPIALTLRNLRGNGISLKEILTSTLPEPIDACDLLASNLSIPPELVCGILHKGSKMVIGGGSKSFKTWTLIDLAVSVATGTKWWDFATNQSRVMYLNLEIQDAFFNRRLKEVCAAKGCQLSKG